MVEFASRPARFRWLWFAAVAATLLLAALLPLNVLPRNYAGPDVLLALTRAWVIRKPEHLPFLVIAAVMLLADLLLQRPPGLWAALVLLGSQVLRHRAEPLRDAGFGTELLFAALTILGVFAGYTLITALAFLPQPAASLSLSALAGTLLAYPACALSLRYAYSTRSEVDPE
ncbi:MAG: rod shape-determining protein MreD [Pseudomonadota bacterium]